MMYMNMVFDSAFFLAMVGLSVFLLWTLANVIINYWRRVT